MRSNASSISARSGGASAVADHWANATRKAPTAVSASSELTRSPYDWLPSYPGLLDDIDAGSCTQAIGAPLRPAGERLGERIWRRRRRPAPLVGGSLSCGRMHVPKAIRSRAPSRVQDLPTFRAVALAVGLIPPRPMHSAAEAALLTRLATGARAVVEIGVYEGSSAWVLLRCAAP